MFRKTLGAVLLCCLIVPVLHAQKTKSKNVVAASAVAPGLQDRQYWCDLLYKITYPVVHNLAQGTLRKNMPQEAGNNYFLNLPKVTHLEAVGRTMAGLAPWLALPDDTTKEGRQRKQLREELVTGLRNAVDPSSPDYLNFRTETQPLVDAAYVAEAFFRAPAQLWDPLDSLTKRRYIEEFKALRDRKPWYNNWLLFSAMTEAFLLKIGEQYDPARIDFALRKSKEWYAGDGWYQDGEHFAMDYYNSYVIHAMLLEVQQVMLAKKLVKQEDYDLTLKRMVRYSEYQERIISPEGTYPPVGRSITYRVGAFHALNLVALMHQLPEYVLPAQVRCALTKVIHNQFEAPGTFDANGWLQLGYAGHQQMIADQYTSTGSLYICSLGFLALGLPATDPFWAAPPADWTAKKAWSGQSFKKDYQVDY